MGGGEIFPPLHGVPLVGRLRLGHEVRHVGHHGGEAAADLLAQPRDRLGHVEDAVQVGLPLAGQPAHEVELHPGETVFHRPAAAFVEVVVADLLADLPPHVVAGGLGGQRQPVAAVGVEQVAQQPQLLVDPQAGQRHAHAQRPERLLQAAAAALRSADNRRWRAPTARPRCSPCCDRPRPPRATIVSTWRNRTGRLVVVLWQKRQRQGQPRMISSVMRSCTHSTCGTTGAAGSGNASRSATTAGSIRSGTPGRSGRTDASRPPASYCGCIDIAARRRRAAGRPSRPAPRGAVDPRAFQFAATGRTPPAAPLRRRRGRTGR